MRTTDSSKIFYNTFVKTLKSADRLRAACRFSEAADAYRAVLGKGYWAPAALGLAHSLRMMGRFTPALAAYRKVVLMEKAPLSKADARVGEALCLKALVDHTRALKLMDGAERLYRNTGDEAGLAHALWARAVILRVSCDFKAAFEAAREALGMFEYYGDREGQTYAHCALGGLARILGDFGESREQYTEALRLALRRKDVFAIAYAHCGLGNTRRMKGDFTGALKEFKAAEKGYAIIGDVVSYSYTLWSMGMTGLFLKRYKEAETCFLKANANFESTGDGRGMAYVHMGLAQLKMLRRQNPAADLKAARALTAETAIGWEHLMARVVEAHAKPRTMKKLCEKITAYGSSWRPVGFPINIP
jgi:tetratricopeptide (TPR) repeat protein